MMREMLPIIVDTNFNRLCFIDDYKSFIWTSRYYLPGDFELVIDVHSNARQYIQKDFYVVRDNDQHVGIIEYVKIEKNADGEEIMIIKGSFLSSIIGRRIIEKQTQVKGTIPACIQTLLNDNAINPTTTTRQIPGLSFSSSVTQATTMEQQFTGKNLLESIESICETYGIGFEVLLNTSNQFVFTLFEGVDRSYNQTANPYVIFSDLYDNLLSSEYEENYQDIVTDVLVAGEGEGLDRKTIWASKTTNSGLARYEAYVDARNASTNNGEITDAVYYQQLTDEGLENITTFTQAFSGSVDMGNYNYPDDVDVGDIVVIENTKWGVFMNSRIVEIIESMSEAGEYSVIPTFGV